MFLGGFRRWVFRRYRNSQIKHHALGYLFWECTLRCNMSCRHCGSDCLKSSGIPDMPLSEFVRVLDDIKARGVSRLTVCITGGEPLLRDDIERAGAEIVRRGWAWGIVTNGLALTGRRFQSLVAAGMSSMSFDLDGLAAEHSFLRRNPESFSRTVAGIRIAADFMRSNPGRFLFDVITCVHPGNLQSLPELRGFLIELGVPAWRIFTIYPQGRARGERLSLSGAEYVRLMEFIAETRSYRTADGRSIRLNYSCEGYLGAWELKVRDHFFFCRSGVSVASVMCDGSIGGCLSVRGADFIQGNIRRDSFMDVWENRFRDMRDRSWAKRGACRNCRQWKNCMGNGMHLHPDKESGVMHCNYRLLTETAGRKRNGRGKCYSCAVISL